MEISVVLTTNRLGGLDLLYWSMQQQDFGGEFEVLLTDEWHAERARYVEEHWPRGARFDFIHLPPRRKSAIMNDTSGYNTALVRARGELVVFLTDYSWVPPHYLQAHWDWHGRNPGWAMSCYLDRYDLPEMKPGPFTIERDWFTVWDETVFSARRSAEWFAGHDPIYRERRGPSGKIHDDGKIEIPACHVYLLGDSFPLALLRELNGLDERYDGGYGSNDVDLGTRASLVGWRFGLNTEVRAMKFGTATTSARIPSLGKTRLRDSDGNHRFFQARCRAIMGGREDLRTPDGWGLV